MDSYAHTVRWIWSLWYLYWIAAAFGTKKTVRSESWLSMLWQRSFLAPGYALLFVPVTWAGLGTFWLPPNDYIKVFGVGLCVLGLGYCVWARRILGTNWSGIVTLKKDHELVQSGPYAYSRHPIYTGLLCASLGLVLEEGALRAVLGFILVAISFHIKMRTEERFMGAQFGSTYTVYSAKVKKLVPFVY
ncbi:MAG: methyltransferase family protein [bacterium]